MVNANLLSAENFKQISYLITVAELMMYLLKLYIDYKMIYYNCINNGL